MRFNALNQLATSTPHRQFHRSSYTQKWLRDWRKWKIYGIQNYQSYDFDYKSESSTLMNWFLSLWIKSEKLEPNDGATSVSQVLDDSQANEIADFEK